MGLREKLASTEHDQTLELYQGNIIDFLLLYIATGLFVLIIFFASIQILVRNVLFPLGYSPSVAWAEAAARMAFIVLTYLGAALSTRNREHISVDFLINQLREKNKLVSYISLPINSILVVSFVAIVTYGLFWAMLENWESGIAGVPLTLGHIYLTMLISFLFMLIFELINAKNDLRKHIGDL